MTLLEGIKLYPKAIGWAALIAMCCAMEGYDIALIGNFYAFPPFNEKYGDLQPDGSYQVPARWQAGLANGAQCGQIIGLLSKRQFGDNWVVLTDGSYRSWSRAIRFQKVHPGSAPVPSLHDHHLFYSSID
jgi:hypothetical protein